MRRREGEEAKENERSIEKKVRENKEINKEEKMMVGGGGWRGGGGGGEKQVGHCL
jgi:hypothetical protein